MVYATVAVPRGVPEALTYAVPDEMVPFLQPGMRVRVPLRGREVTGLVLAVEDATNLDPSIIRNIIEILDSSPLLPKHLLDLGAFISGYYRCPIGDTFAAMLPAKLLRTDAEIAELTLTGAAVQPATRPGRQRRILELLGEKGPMPIPSLLLSSGSSTRTSLQRLLADGLVTIRRRRRDRPPRIEVAAVRLQDRPDEELLSLCARSPRQREVFELLKKRGPAMLVRDLQEAVGCSPGVIREMIRKGMLEKFTQLPPERPRWALRPGTDRPTLTAEQQRAVEAVVSIMENQQYAPFLLEGVTGSGKTEVYLRCLERVIAAGKTGLVLVPEIGLTPAAVGAVERRFGERVAVLHSAQSDSERWRQWKLVEDGGADIVIGPRSALFAPVERLGLIVVDEEHDAAYKQGENPRYQARDLALVLGNRLQIPVLLCSATPSLEAAALVERGLARRLVLRHRVAGGSLPHVEVVDLRQEPPEPGEQGRTLFSGRLRELMSETLARGEQIILLIQRRGWAPILLCRDCGHKMECPECSVPLVLHRRTGGLRCHYCGHYEPVPDACPVCGGRLLDAVGAGTEKVAHHLARYFPEATAAILDRDTVRRKNGLQATLGSFASGKTQVLIGTQMVAKGHHFPNVTLTGVISADSLLGLPDFRAAERTFQLLTQVAGRAGRGPRPGHVIIQTYYPDHPAIRCASTHDVDGFNREELVYRQSFSYPPATRMALVRFESQSSRAAQAASEAAARAITPTDADTRLRGPSAAPLERLRGYWRWQLLISAPNRTQLRAILEKIERVRSTPRVRRVIDVDPLSTL
ncbi:MAG: primosomal protein N' [Nitrospiraceae bacterium]|nr:primosomal protein N' [Nitrospiraceae bacterium]